MATDTFPATQKWKISATDEQFLAAAFTVPENQRTRYVRLSVINKGISSGSFRVAIYTDRGLTKLYAASAWRSVSDIESELNAPFGAFWRGIWGFEFASPYPRLQADTTYYLAVEATGYTKGSNFSSYVAFSLDEPFEINDNQGSPVGLAFEMYSYRKVRVTTG